MSDSKGDGQPYRNGKPPGMSADHERRTRKLPHAKEMFGYYEELVRQWPATSSTDWISQYVQYENVECAYENALEAAERNQVSYDEVAIESTELALKSHPQGFSAELVSPQSTFRPATPATPIILARQMSESVDGRSEDESLELPAGVLTVPVDHEELYQALAQLQVREQLQESGETDVTVANEEDLNDSGDEAGSEGGADIDADDDFSDIGSPIWVPSYRGPTRSLRVDPDLPMFYLTEDGDSDDDTQKVEIVSASEGGCDDPDSSEYLTAPEDNDENVKSIDSDEDTKDEEVISEISTDSFIAATTEMEFIAKLIERTFRSLSEDLANSIVNVRTELIAMFDKFRGEVESKIDLDGVDSNKLSNDKITRHVNRGILNIDNQSNLAEGSIHRHDSDINEKVDDGYVKEHDLDIQPTEPVVSITGEWESETPAWILDRADNENIEDGNVIDDKNVGVNIFEDNDQQVPEPFSVSEPWESETPARILDRADDVDADKENIEVEDDDEYADAEDDYYDEYDPYDDDVQPILESTSDPTWEFDHQSW